MRSHPFTKIVIIFYDDFCKTMRSHDLMQFLLILSTEIRPDDALEKLETCLLTDYILVLCVTALPYST